ncbi:leucine-rich repeat domain-containing protein [Paenimyroides ceti]
MKFNYKKVTENTICITGCETNSSKIIIPDSIDGFLVTNIGYSAFYNNQLTSVELPAGLTNIGDYAFYSNQLTSVELPAGLTHIGNSAFHSNQLTSVELPAGLTHIGNSAFHSNQLTSVELPAGLTHIGNSAFHSNQLTSVELPAGLTHIGNSAFHSNQLTSVELPAGLTNIGDYAFSSNQLTSVELPAGLTNIGDYAFSSDTVIIQGNKNIQMIDGIATIIRSKRKRDIFQIYQGSIFNTNENCFVAKRDNYYAHGKTIKDAIEDVNFKFLQENLEVKDLVKEIKQKKLISVSEFRLITGACKMGCESFMSQKGLTETTYPLDKAIELLQGQFGWSKIKEHFI